jgi:hypothetical protein
MPVEGEKERIDVLAYVEMENDDTGNLEFPSQFHFSQVGYQDRSSMPVEGEKERSDVLAYVEMENDDNGDLEFPSQFHFSQVGHQEEDHAWSVLSNSFFLAGSSSYLILSLWDLYAPSPTGMALACYKFVTAFGALIYLFDSMIDITWARVVQDRQHVQRYRQKIMMEAIHIDDPENIPSTKKKATFFRRVRKHAGHRRALLSALFFGIASFLAVINWSVDNFAIVSGIPWIPLSVHAYLLSAIFAVTGTRSRPWCAAFSFGDADTLEDMGDIFFMVGSIVDMLLCDFPLDEDYAYYGWAAVISAVLWCLDACLYLSSDFVFKEALRKEKMEFLKQLDGDEYSVTTEGGSKIVDSRCWKRKHQCKTDA